MKCSWVSNNLPSCLVHSLNGKDALFSLLRADYELSTDRSDSHRIRILEMPSCTETVFVEGLCWLTRDDVDKCHLACREWHRIARDANLQLPLRKLKELVVVSGTR